MENKGQYNEECNRTACDNKPAVYYNHSTQMYYCKSCAELINTHNKADAMRMYGHDLCTLVSPPTPLPQTEVGEDLPAPIGDFIFEQTDIIPLISHNGNYYHYSDVCTLLNRVTKKQ